MGRTIEADDPLTAAIAPPPDETQPQREERLMREADAKRVSDEIDDMLRAEKAAARKKRKPVKVLLLGQSESGKSTTLKNFQLTYARKAWQEERESWRAVIQLNLIRSVNFILDILNSELSGSPEPGSPLIPGDEDEDDGDSTTPSSHTPLVFTEKHRLLKLRLAPLRRLQRDLEHRLGTGTEEPTEAPAPTTAAPFDYPWSVAEPLARKPQEFYVRSSSGWKSALEKIRPRTSTGSRDDSARARREQEADETGQIISECREDMQAVWEDPVVKEMLNRRRLRLEDSGGFFLNDVDRVAARDYTPSDDDVMRARLRTIGVQEYSFTFEKGAETGHEWLMYDVGGARTLRQAWSAHFDDVNAIIFLAPINCFDEKLTEDHRVNRLEDSFLLWKAVCANKLLARTQLILFLNKCDLLEKKLRSGARVKDYVPSFADRTNNASTVAKYFKQKFKDMSKQYSPEPRPFYVHLTSVIDTKATAITLGAVREGILREHLRGADFI